MTSETTTTDQSVAEIMGWERCGTYWVDEPEGVYESPQWRRQDGCHVTRYDCDDMLNWLLNDAPGVTVLSLGPGSPRSAPSHSRCRPSVHVRIDGPTRSVATTHNASTLHAALEAAVRAVAAS